MKSNIVSTFIFLLITVAAFAQSSNAILFTENGEKFQLVLNGILQNANPETNVKLTSLPANHYKARIIFADTKLGYIDFNMYFNEPGNEVTWNIKQNNKGEYVVRGISTVPIAQAPVAPSSQTVMVYSSTAPSTTTTTTTHTTQTSGNNNGFSMNMGVNANDDGGNISINASGMDPDMTDSKYSSTSTTVTTTTHSSSTTYDETPTVVYVPGYSGKVGCPRPLSETEFADMKHSIISKDFENSKLTIAKQVLQNNCLTASQVKELVSVFEFENTKLDFAKYAYDRTYDINNYYKINDAFEFESSIDELNKYITNH